MTRILVLGGGPAGYVAALRAAQLGAEVTLVEQRDIGGTCLNRGCIPTKAMVAGAERLHLVQEAADYGVTTGALGLDLAAFVARREAVTRQLRDGVEHLLAARKVRVVTERASLAGPGRLVTEGGARLEGDAVIIATGSEPVRPGLFGWDDPRVMTSDELLRLQQLPASLAIVGGGVIGCEFAAVFARLGVEVTVVELLDQLLPGETRRVGRALQTAFRKRGIKVQVRTAVEATESTGGGVRLRLAGGDQVTADAVLVSVGRGPLSADLGLEEAGVRLDEHGFVVTDDTLRTAVDGVFAAGDVAGPPLLAHWAYHEGQVAAENAVTGGSAAVDRRVVPNCVFTTPEVASVGLTEDAATAQGVAHDVAQARFDPNSKAVVDGDADGFVRVVSEPGGGRLLGASLVGPHVTELVHELATAIAGGLTLDDVARTIHAHPTLSEAIGEAALAGMGRGMHSL